MSFHYRTEEAGWVPHTVAIWGPHWYVAARTLKRRDGRCVTPKTYETARKAWEIATFGAPIEQLEAAAPRLFRQLVEAGLTPDLG